MNLPYEWRLGWMALASFFVLNLVLAASVYVITPWAVRWGGKMRARHGARLLLFLRLAPAGIALAVVLGLCIPSWIQFEPRQAKEEVSLLFLLGGLFGVAVLGTCLFRALQRIWWSVTFLRLCRRATLDASSDIWLIEAPAAVMALAGIVRPRIIVSHGVWRNLGAGEREAAIGHERAHAESRDNLKRLLIGAAPGMLPGLTGFGRLEESWERLSEWAADDRAVEGSHRRSLSLAAALVRVARMGGLAPSPRLAAIGARALVGNQLDLKERVERLLEESPPSPAEIPVGTMSVVGTFVLCLGILATQPGALEWVHRILEDFAE